MAVKTIYMIIGYTHEDFKNDWDSYGAFTTYARAEEEAKRIASDTAKGYKHRAQTEPEEYGDMANTYWELRHDLGYIDLLATGHIRKHLHLEIRATTLRSGRD